MNLMLRLCRNCFYTYELVIQKHKFAALPQNKVRKKDASWHNYNTIIIFRSILRSRTKCEESNLDRNFRENSLCQDDSLLMEKDISDDSE